MKILVSSLLLISILFANEKVSLQLMWYDQFQFAGYYMAKEKGFYKNEGLDVEIKKFVPKMDTTKEVTEGRADFGIGRTSLIIDKGQGKDIILLAAILQSSPLVLISKKESGIDKIQDFKNKRVMLTGTKTSAGIFGMLSSNGITYKDLIILESKNKLENLIADKVDIISAYTSNQVYILKQKGVELNIFNPKDYGFDFYSDILFTSKEEYENHPKRVLAFKRASIKGWEYAFSHINEAVELIMKKYNTQNKTRSQLFYEAITLKKLAYKDTNQLGKISKEQLKRIYDIYKIMGFIKNTINIDDLIVTSNLSTPVLNKKEKEWIKKHPVITYSEVNWKPLSIIENGKMKGIFGDYLDLISKKTGLKFLYIKAPSWDKVVDMFKNGKIDLLPSNPQNIKNLGLISKVYKTFPMVIVTDDRYKYLASLDNLKGKTVVVPKYYTSYYYIKNNYPQIKIKTTKDIKEALTLLNRGEADAFIGHIATSMYYINILNFTNLKIAGTTNFEFKHAYLIQNRYPELLSIINKGFDSITEEEKAKINSKWSIVNLEEKSKLDYMLIFKIIIISLLIFIFLLYRNRKLNRYNKEIEELKNRLEWALVGNKEGLWDRDYTNNTVYRSPRWKEILGYKDNELPNEIDVWEKRIHPDDIEKALKDMQNHLEGKTEYYDNIHRLKHKDGHWVWIHDRGKKIIDRHSKALRVIGTSTDITKEKEIEQKLKHQQQIIEQIHECVISMDLKGNITSWNRGAESLFLYRKDEILGKHIKILFNTPRLNEKIIERLFKILQNREKFQTELEFLKKSKEIIFAEITISIFKDENEKTIGMIGYIKDVTQRKIVEKELKKQEEILKFQANYDALTKLPNRVLFIDRLNQSIKRAKRHNFKFALMFLDLDRFKQINDSLGHEIGDKVLIEIAERINSIIRKEDTLARLGGDEFIIITGEIKKSEDVAVLAKKIISALKTPITINQQYLFVTTSIGISIFPDDSTNFNNLLKYADSAMYKAKDEGRANYQFYTSSMTIVANEKIALETSLRLGIKNREFVVYYQPQIDARSNTLTGLEALVRWNHPKKGLIPPNKFLPLAEETGLITEIDRIVMEDAFEQIKEWNQKGLKTGILSLNLSMDHLHSKDFINYLEISIFQHSIKSESIGFEVTESKVMKKSEEMIPKLQKLNDMNIELAVDDFGTGYSSLSYLKKLPVSTIKIDQSFIRHLLQNEEDKSIVKAIIAIAKSLKLNLIAEGVEEKEQVDFLLENGCNIIQGYFYSKPLDSKNMEKFLSEI